MNPETSPESEEEAKINARKNLEKAITSVPRKLRVKIDHLPKHIEKIPAGQTEKLRELFKVVDHTSQHLQKFAACKKGCSACCLIPVEVTETEIAYIEKYTGAKRTTVQQRRNFHGEPCPFLKDGECSIYEHRPYACRRHMAFTKTAHWCAPDRCNQIEVSMVYSERRDQFPSILNSFISLAGVPKFDIRQVFSKHSLDNGRAQKQTCYCCGKPATSREHIPPKCIFPESPNFRKNLITVPACDEHNSDKSLEDEFLMACVTPSVLNNKLGVEETRTRLKATLEKKPGLLAAAMKNITWFDKTNTGIVLAQADVPRLEREFELIARGLYFHENGRRFEGKCNVMTNFVVFIGKEDRMREACRRTTKKLVDKEKKGWQWKGANTDVFEYHLEENDGIGLVALRFFQGVEVYIGLKSSKKQHLDEVMNDWPSVEELKQIRPKSEERWTALRRQFENRKNCDASLTRIVKIANLPVLQDVADPHHTVVLWQYLGEGEKFGEQIKKIGAENPFQLHGYALSELEEHGLIEGTDTEEFVELATTAGTEIAPNGIHALWDRRSRKLATMGAKKPTVLVNSHPLATWLALVLMTNKTKASTNAFEASLEVFARLDGAWGNV